MYFRHQLAHVHHCPYDIRTAYSLERAAYDVVHDWDLAYLATQIFSDVQVDLHYLPQRFRNLPYHARIVGRKTSTLSEKIMEAVYLCINPAVKIINESLAEAAREIILVSSLDRPWQVKVQMIASILQRLKRKNSREFSDKEIKKSVREDPISVREDFLQSTIEGFSETYGAITNEKAAKEFYEQWIRPRLLNNEKEKIKKILKLSIKRESKRLEEIKSEKKEAAGRSKDEKSRRFQNLIPSTSSDSKDEPSLPTSLSKPYHKIRSKNLMRFYGRDTGLSLGLNELLYSIWRKVGAAGLFGQS